jgi:hypothetical protein
MSPDPRVRRGAHRTSRAASATLLPSLLAILAVTSLITALYVWRGEDAKPPSAAAAPAPSSSTSPTATVSTKATPKKSDEPVATTGSPQATKHKSRALLRADIDIVVLNDTTRPGLASTAATQLRAKGWSVTGVGNFRGVVSATTVYYPVGHVAAAQAAAKSLPTPPRVLPRFGNLSTTRLTVVVAANYPG